jgi:uncharacterized protein
MAADVAGLVAAVARALVDEPDAVAVEQEARGRRRIVRLKVAPGDMGRIIGRDGRIANAIRALLAAAAEDESWTLEIGD